MTQNDKLIVQAIEANEEFLAAAMILTQQGWENPQLHVWSAGPEKGQRIISAWMEHHGLTWDADNTLTTKGRLQ